MSARRNIEATRDEMTLLFPKIKSYSFIPLNTALGRFDAGGDLYHIAEGVWYIEAYNEGMVYRSLMEFLDKVRGGDRRKGDDYAHNNQL